jgi:hypothetical protein
VPEHVPYIRQSRLRRKYIFSKLGTPELRFAPTFVAARFGVRKHVIPPYGRKTNHYEFDEFMIFSTYCN